MMEVYDVILYSNYQMSSLLVLLIKHAYHKLGNMNKLSPNIKLGGLDGHVQFQTLLISIRRRALYKD